MPATMNNEVIVNDPYAQVNSRRRNYLKKDILIEYFRTFLERST